MDEEIETLMIDVRAGTTGFQADVETMRSSIDNSLLSGFEQAGNVLERGLLSAIWRCSLGFDDLKRVALNAMNEIAATALQSGLSGLFGASGGSGGGVSGLIGNTIGALFGLPGRATGGPVAPGSAFLVGERGPEIFVPTSAGRIEANPSGGNARDVNVAINLSAPRGTDNPVMLRRSTRQVASAIARAMRSA